MRYLRGTLPRVIETPIVTDAIIDRVKYTSLKITITGDRYRKKKGGTFDK